jgi:Cu(I)/Ag(I) efflux system membrane fusion protein
MLSQTQVRLGNITTQKVTSKAVGQTLAVNGVLAVDEDRSAVISSRVAGRIERLYIKETGRMVRQGEPLYEIYSETLLTLQREYLLAREQYLAMDKQPRYEAFMKSAARKLELYGLTPAQIAGLATNNTPQQHTTVYAPAAGMVTQIAVDEGGYVAEGSEMYRVEDVRTLRLDAELYAQETGLVRAGDTVQIRISGYEAQPVEAVVTFLSPEYKAGTQIVIMRAVLKNPGNRFKPGMQAQVLLTHSAHRALAVPADAVIRSGKGAHVYVLTAPNTFTPRVVQTGLENFNEVSIVHGLQEGEEIAATGAYLLYSELMLRRGIDPMSASTAK